MATLLQKVKSKMFIFAHRRARGMLDGEYAAIFRGRSLDFDDLRAYVPGDEVRDIDWKASARHGSPLIKRYVAVRKQTVLLVADTGRNMAAVSRNGAYKKDIMVLAMGVIGYLALQHGDRVGLVYGDNKGTAAVEPRSSEGHLESLLQTVSAQTSLESGRSDLLAQLNYIAQHVSTRRLIFVVADEHPVAPEMAKMLRRLRAQHEILCLVLEDADLAHGLALANETFDVEASDPVISLLTRDPKLAAEYSSAVQARKQEISGLLRQEGISAEWLGEEDDVLPAIFRLLERHRRAGR